MSKTKNFCWALVLNFAFISPALAIIDLKGANFSDSYIDLTILGSGFDLKIDRGYNSRTLHNGIFGFGWCSSLESSLIITPESNIKHTECGAGQETLYVSKGFSEKDIDKTIKAIIEKVKKESPTVQSDYINNLEKKLKSDTLLRSEYTTKFSIARPIADKTKFYANGKDTDIIEKNGSYYIRTTPDGTIQKYSLTGRIEKIHDRNGNYISLNYDGKRVHDIADNNGRKIIFSYYENGKVKSVTGPNNTKAEYKYKNLNDLIWVKTASGNIFTYDYDDLHNLTKVSFPDKTTKEITYNKNMDWVIGYKDIDGCVETYEYKLSEDNPKDHFWATVTKKCKSKVTLRAKYEFWYDFNVTRTGKYLKKSKTQENDYTTDIVYNETGRPLTVTNGKKITKFEYYDNGLLKKKTLPTGETTQLFYENTFKKVSKVVKAGRATEFSYDNKGNLTKAWNSEGQKVTLGYDLRGRISSIEDQAKRKVAIKYDERFSKPSIIERDGIGSINVAYGKRGEIDKVTSPAGPSVAIQVASTFSNLLDLIQPAGVNLSL